MLPSGAFVGALNGSTSEGAAAQPCDRCSPASRRCPVLPWSGVLPSVPGLASPPAPWRVVGEVAGGAVGVVRSSWQAVGDALSALPRGLADVSAVLTDAGQDRSRRRVWSRGGRAHIEVRGLSGRGECHDRLVGALGTALCAVEGVRWAAVNAVLGQVVVDVDEDDFGLDRLVELVEQVEKAHGSDGETFAGHRPHPPFDAAPAVLAGASLAADCLGLVVASLGQAVPWSAPALLRVPVVLAETQPRLRRLLDGRLGRAHAEMVLGVSNAAVHSLTRGMAPLAVDAVQRLWQLAEIRSRQAVWSQRENELVGDGDALPRHAPERARRPAPLPAGPVEACGHKTSLAALLGSGGVLAWTCSPEQAAQAILATVPKAAGMGREAFSARLGRDLARDGVVPMDGTALRLLDRVSTVLIDSTVLCAPRPRLLSAVATGRLDDADVWRAGQSALLGRSLQELCGPGPWICEEWRLERPADAPHGRPDAPSGLPLDLRDAGGRRQGRVLVGCELDPLADALLGTARSAGRRLLLTEHASADELVSWADEAVPMSASLPEEVQRLQQDGQVVLLLTSAEDRALAAADVGVTVLPGPGGAVPVCWSAHLICGPGLAQAWRVLAALDEAHQVSSRSARLCLGASALGALIAASRTRRTMLGLTTSPVHGAAFLAQIGGLRAARRLARKPLPPPRIRSVWHALEAHEIFGVLGALSDGPDGRATAGSLAESGRTAQGALAAAVHTMADAAGLAATARGAAQLVTAVREELRDPLTPVLALGAAASAAVGSGIDSALVGGVMAGNAVVSGVQRLRAERALNGLLLAEQQMARRVHWTPVASTARRPDRSRFFTGLQTAPVHTTTAQDLRVGDIIALRPSDIVPADARLLVSDRLEIDEATMTGESVPVAKDPAATPGAELAERSCMVYQGCTVLAGTGYAVVVATGAQTEAGRAADLAGTATTPPGIESHLAALTRTALPAVGIGGAAVTLLGLLRGVPVREALASGVAVAVAAVPEGLPLVATVAQSAAARRLSRHGILTRSARVLEALGRVDVVCFDKTGTLTQGRLSVTGLATHEHELRMDSAPGRHLLQTAARACPTPKAGQRLPHATDQAVVDAATAHCAPDHTWRSLTELPFEASRGYSACLGTESGDPYLAVKGAPETVLARCTATLSTPHEPGNDSTVPVNPARRRAAHHLVQRMAAGGLRVLAVAEARPTSPANPSDDVADLAHDLTLLGFLAIADPVRPGAAETVKRLSEAGVRTAMITGDHPATAAAIARELGIPDGDTVLTGAELDTLSERARLRRIAQTAVFARVSPEHKVRIVQALQRTGHVVAMTGDGVNDAAAIRLADVGIGLSAHGSTSARAAADLVLTDPDPTRLLEALIEGRTLWHSVRDAVAILVGGNAGEVAFTVLGTALSGRAPLGTRQLLLVNLLTDMLPALAVALAPARAPKPGEDPLTGGPVSSLLGRDLVHVLAVRGTATTLSATTAWQIGRFTGLQRRASTMGLAALVGTQLGQTLITDWHSPLVLVTAGLSTAALVAVVQTPGISHFFGCTPLGPIAWATVTACAATSTVAAALAPRLLDSQPAATPA
ncbi:cation-translocating P-type ATPase [Streptomyces sp. PSKA54]|uniref:Cation-translocating P-type ATPase n=1 Tax=Streptomyces himalayensis subsp. aureolus TaxID=2758039 RepID=A0A7W2HEC8_9ACTN|nr:cation-translocating P-type ATPase [Streptomyces himalayensis subsp. aureolus]